MTRITVYNSRSGATLASRRLELAGGDGREEAADLIRSTLADHPTLAPADVVAAIESPNGHWREIVPEVATA